MNTQTDCEQLSELIPAYSIGATDDEETRLVEEGLKRCPDLATELAQYTSINDRIAEAAPTLMPPPAILTNLLASAKASPRKPRSRPVWQWVAACLALILVVSNAYWITRLNSEAIREVTLAATTTSSSPQGSGRIIWSSQSENAVLIVQNMPLLTPDSAYQAWLRRGETRVNLGVFRVDEKGDGTLTIAVSNLIEPFDTMGITTEPLGGSPAPTSPAVIRWTSS